MRYNIDMWVHTHAWDDPTGYCIGVVSRILILDIPVFQDRITLSHEAIAKFQPVL